MHICADSEEWKAELTVETVESNVDDAEWNKILTCFCETKKL